MTILRVMSRQLQNWEEGKSISYNKLKNLLPQCAQGGIDPNISTAQHCAAKSNKTKKLKKGEMEETRRQKKVSKSGY